MSTSSVPTFNPRELLELYQGEKYDALSEELLRVLWHFQQVTYTSLTNETQYFVDAFLKQFLYFFTQVDYLPSQQHLVRFIELNLTIANVAALSSFGTTDPFVQILARQPRNYGKLLAIYSPRNSIQIDTKIFFDAEPGLASLWYSQALEMYRSGSVNPTAWENLKRLVQAPDARITAFHNVSDVYFGATYLDGGCDRLVRRMVNETIKAKTNAAAPTIENRPNPRHLAIATSLWFPGHSVYRILSDFVDSLRGDYKLTLIHLGPIRDNIDIGPFHHMKYVGFHGGKLNIESIRRNDFGMLFFPDVGMSTESIFLANLRLAPIQACGLGQSVSTYATEIDYYISGADVERADLAGENYSERLVLLPGFGCIHRRPEYTLRRPDRKESRFIVNCSWYPQKINFPLLELLSEINERTEKELVFRMFVGGGLARKNDHLPFVHDVEAVLGRRNVEVIAGRGYEDYMAIMEEGDINLDSFPFGGCNVIVDSLYLRKPTVTYEGTKWYNRIGSQMLRAAGLPELIATSDAQYVALAARLIDDDNYRRELAERLAEVDLDATIFSRESQRYFARAVKQLLERNEEYQRDESRAPIYVK